METETAARIRLSARQQQLLIELEQVKQELEQLDTQVVVSQWWDRPSGPYGRGTLYHSGLNEPCSPTNSPDQMTLYRALRVNLAPCPRCAPAKA